MSQSKIAELRQMVAAATSGPWGINKYGSIGTGDHFIFGGTVVGREGFEEDKTGNAKELIVALRNHAEELLAVAEAAREFWQKTKHESDCPCCRCRETARLRAALADLEAQR